jgi:hypothetical protein
MMGTIMVKGGGSVTFELVVWAWEGILNIVWVGKDGYWGGYSIYRCDGWETGRWDQNT